MVCAGAAGNVGVGHVDIDVVEQLIVHEIAIAALMGAFQTDVLVQIVGTNLGKINKAFAVQADELLIGRNRRGTGGKTDHGVGLAGNFRGKNHGSRLGDFFSVTKNMHLHVHNLHYQVVVSNVSSIIAHLS